MQTYAQTFTGAKTWVLNVPGKYFTVLGCTNAVNVAFFKGGQRLPLGTITALLAGLEVMLGEADGSPEGFAFDRVEVGVTAADTVTIGIGNGQARYNRSQGSVTVTSLTPTRAGGSSVNATVTNVSAQLVAGTGLRSYLLIQNKDAAGNVWVAFNGAATQANGVRIPPGGSYELNCNILTSAVHAIGDIASNPNVAVVTG